ncbi:NAD(P)-binding protein [Robertmurraya korlensis]|uniref:phytoene desaturase family protein n=1 Tax=Robertmurraya korlensis TaxID=519977 RepID=UPI00203DF9AF|nr:NAD(P)-binding protein [Robertmurraya korlensis]MCM3601365.1 NAD(P)-binding protein [Robertmurraya korlensis]
MKPSVCIIGSGMGGLTAGAFLAKNGYDVTILEKATSVGGSAGFYTRKDRRFPTGATVAFGLEEDGILTKLLNELDIQPPKKELFHPMDVILPDRKVSIYKDKTRWERELERRFSERDRDVLLFWKKLEQIGEDVLSVTKSEVSLPIQRLYDLGSFPSFALNNPLSVTRLAKYATWTVEKLLKTYNLHTYLPLRQFLDAQLIDAVQTDVSEAALLPTSVALTIYRKGSFALENGFGQLCEQLKDFIIQCGGRVYLSSPLKKVQFDQTNKLWQVESKKCNESFSIIINNSGISFGDHTSYENNDFSWGAFRIDATLRQEVTNQLQGNITPFAYQIVSDHPQLATYCHNPIYATFHESQSRGELHQIDEVLMTISVHTEDKRWVQLSKESYIREKKFLMDLLMQEVEKVCPFKDYLLFAEAGTPLTYKRFVGKTKVGGFPLTVKNAVWKPRSFRTKLPNWYIVGEQAFPGPGTLSAALSGYYASRAIIKENS